MKKDCKSCAKSWCAGSWIAFALLVIGGINWGLVGIGMFVGKNLNVVNLIFGRVEWLESVIYLLVALAALIMLFGCRCKKCKSGSCAGGRCEEKGSSCAACDAGSCSIHMKSDSDDSMM